MSEESEDWFWRIWKDPYVLPLIFWFKRPNKTKNSGDIAAKLGYLHIIKNPFPEELEYTTDAINWAAENGQLKVVKWLHENRTEGCTKWAMD